MSPSDSQRAQIIEVLRSRYFAMIQPLPGNTNQTEIEKNRLSRSLAAFAIEKLAEVAPAQAANAVVDGGNDNGLDAIHFDRMKNILWLVQSKIGAAADMGDNKKFCDGIRDLIQGNFHKFNASFARLQPDVEDALESPGLQFIGCQIHLGSNPLGPHAVQDLNQLKGDLNQFVVRFAWQEIDLPAAHGWLVAEHALSPVNTNLILRKWYGFDHPRRAFYGIISACDLAALYLLEGKKLFEKNIRHYLGIQEVNSAIASTVKDRPQELFYLNNGITAICSKITPLPGANNNEGTFSIEGFSIVNGAQTVGSIACTQNISGVVSPDAKLLITLIEVGNAPGNPGSEITRTRNTQTEANSLSFAALDAEQERLRRELKISGIIYRYRLSAEAAVNGEITIERAALAQACLSGDTRIIVAAKKSIGLLYDRDGEFYPQLFNSRLSGIQLCRSVRIYDNLNGILNASEQAETDWYRRMYYRHGRFFILHILSRRKRSIIEKAEPELSTPDQAELSRAVTELAELIYSIAESKFNRAKGYLAVFRNLTDAEPLSRDVMKRLAEIDNPQSPAIPVVVVPAAGSLPGGAASNAQSQPPPAAS